MEHRHGLTSERLREHLARADGELGAAQQFLDPGTRDEARLVGAIADAKALVGDTLERARQLEGAARRLLLALNDNQAHDREAAKVEPGEQEAKDAGLRPGSILYRAAVWWLLDMGALIPDREANERLRYAAGAWHHDFAFKITRDGLDMLRRA